MGDGKKSWLHSQAGWLAANVIRFWMHTLHYRMAYYDPTADPFHPACNGSKIYLFWHEYLLFPLFVRAGAPICLLVSRHRDAEVLAQAAERLGFRTFRGSTNRGGTSATLRLMRWGRHCHFAFTPDGPRGPRRKMSLGVIYLASWSGMPVVPVGVGYDRPYRVKSWDRFAIPRPWSRARCILGPAIFVPPGLGRSEIENYCGQIEQLLQRLTEIAEAWASGSVEILESVPLPTSVHDPTWWAGNILPENLSTGKIAASCPEPMSVYSGPESSLSVHRTGCTGLSGPDF